MSNGWTSDRRSRQSKLIQEWKPWESSTGPRTDEGKAVSKMNALKGRLRPTVQLLNQAIKGHSAALEQFEDEVLTSVSLINPTRGEE